MNTILTDFSGQDMIVVMYSNFRGLIKV